MKDDARSGRPSTARTGENVESVHRLNIGKETVRRIVTEDLGKRKICVRLFLMS